MVNIEQRDGRTQGEGREEDLKNWTGHTTPPEPLGNSTALRSRMGTKALSKVTLIRKPSLHLSNSPRLGSWEVESWFSLPRPYRHTLQKLLKQTGRTCLGLLTSISSSSRSCFVVWGMLFDFLGSFFWKTVWFKDIHPFGWLQLLRRVLFWSTGSRDDRFVCTISEMNGLDLSAWSVHGLGKCHSTLKPSKASFP